jgi:hypothetical protein
LHGILPEETHLLLLFSHPPLPLELCLRDVQVSVLVKELLFAAAHFVFLDSFIYLKDPRLKRDFKPLFRPASSGTKKDQKTLIPGHKLG